MGVDKIAEYYLIFENLMSNNSSITTNDRADYYCHLGYPHMSVKKIIKLKEEYTLKSIKDFHFIGEVICKEDISMILSKYNPYRCRFFPISISDKSSETLSNFSLISFENIIPCADMGKSDIFVFPKRKNHIKILSLYLDLEKLKKIPKHKKHIFMVEEAEGTIIVSKEIGEELLTYLSTNNDSSLLVKPIYEDGKVPELF